MPSTDPSTQVTLDDLAQRVQDLTDSLHNHRHTGFDLTQPLINSNISSATITNATTLGDGTSTSGTLSLLRAPGNGSVYIRGGKIAAGDFANAGAASGFIIGEDDADGKDKFYFGNSTSYIKFDGTTLTVVGGTSVSSLNIPDTTTANSFHVDTSGNTWWGANVTSGLSNANASITAAGAAIFKNVVIGGTAIQYVITNSGIFSYGDGSDGTVTLDGSTNFSSFAACLILTIALPTNPSNGNTLVIAFPGGSITFTFVSSIGSTPGNVLIGGSATATVTNLLGLLQSPSTTNTTQVALSSGNQTIVNTDATYTSSTTTLTAVALVAAATFTATTNVTSGTATQSTSSIYTLTRDIYPTDLTVNTGIILQPAGWRIFASDTFVMSGTALLRRNGNVGSNGASNTSANNIPGPAGGLAVPDGYLKGSLAGGNGGGANAGSAILAPAPGNITNSIGVNGTSNATQPGGTATPSNVKLIANWHLATLLDIGSTGATVKFTGSAPSTGADGGGFNGGVHGEGGAAGSAGAIIAIYARSITIAASSIIQSNGGAGGNGGAGNPSGAGGGSGGSGGVIVLVYNKLTNSGTIQAQGGLGGAGGGGPANPPAGLNGNAGIIYEFQLSL